MRVMEIGTLERMMNRPAFLGSSTLNVPLVYEGKYNREYVKREYVKNNKRK